MATGHSGSMLMFWPLTPLLGITPQMDVHLRNDVCAKLSRWDWNVPTSHAHGFVSSRWLSPEVVGTFREALSLASLLPREQHAFLSWQSLSRCCSLPQARRDRGSRALWNPEPEWTLSYCGLFSQAFIMVMKANTKATHSRIITCNSQSLNTTPVPINRYRV